MKFICETSDLNKAVQSVLPAIATKASTPIFAGMHLTASQGKLRLEGMDINLAMSCTIPADVEEEGEILIGAASFGNLVKSMNGEKVTVSRLDQENRVHLQSGNADYKIRLMNVEDYPKFPEFNPDKTFCLEDEEIRELIRKTVFACSNDAARPLFTGVLCEILNGKVTFVGTNTHRLAIRSMPIADTEDMEIIIPSGVLKEINKNLNSKVPQTVKFSLLNNQLMVMIDEWTVVSRLIEGRFPDYKRVIPADFKVEVTVDTKGLAGAVSRMSLCSGNENDYSVVKIIITENQIKVMSSSEDVGSGEETIECKTSGEDINVAFNATYILDIMQHIGTDEAVIKLNNSLSPVCIRPTNDEDYTYIVTPVRVIF